MLQTQILYICRCELTGHAFATEEQSEAISFIETYESLGGDVTRQVITTDTTEQWKPNYSLV